MRVRTGDNNDGDLSNGPVGALSDTKCPAVHLGYAEIEKDSRHVATG